MGRVSETTTNLFYFYLFFFEIYFFTNILNLSERGSWKFVGSPSSQTPKKKFSQSQAWNRHHQSSLLLLFVATAAAAGTAAAFMLFMFT